MSARPWYKRYAVDFIHGTMGLTLEEKGAYSIVLDLIYDRGGPIPDDARYIAGVCGCSLRKWSAIRDRLVLAGKITLSEGSVDCPLVHEWAAVNDGREAIPSHVRRAVVARDGERCTYCGSTTAPFHLDHVMPVSRGGANSLENLVMACAPCNLSKGARTPEEWLA